MFAQRCKINLSCVILRVRKFYRWLDTLIFVLYDSMCEASYFPWVPQKIYADLKTVINPNQSSNSGVARRNQSAAKLLQRFLSVTEHTTTPTPTYDNYSRVSILWLRLFILGIKVSSGWIIHIKWLADVGEITEKKNEIHFILRYADAQFLLFPYPRGFIILCRLLII